MNSENLFGDKKSGEVFLKGIVENIVFRNPENGYTVAKIKDTNTKEIQIITGNLPSLNIGESIKLKGEWTVHKKFGPQIEIIEYESITPMSTDGIKKFLGSGLIKYIGPKTAEAIVEHFGKKTLEIIDKKPKRLLEVEKIGKVKLEQITKGWEEYKSLKDIIIFLQSHNIGIGFALKIFDRYGLDSIEVVNSNPYQLIYDIKGIGFKYADGIEEKLGEDRRLALPVAEAHNYLSSAGFVLQEDANLITYHANGKARLYVHSDNEEENCLRLHFIGSDRDISIVVTPDTDLARVQRFIFDFADSEGISGSNDGLKATSDPLKDFNAKELKNALISFDRDHRALF